MGVCAFNSVNLTRKPSKRDECNYLLLLIQDENLFDKAFPSRA